MKILSSSELWIRNFIFRKLLQVKYALMKKDDKDNTVDANVHRQKTLVIQDYLLG